MGGIDCFGLLVLLIPVIIFIVHLIGALARANQGPPGPVRGRPAAPPFRPNRAAPEQVRPRTDLERFLQEVQQRREGSKGEQPAEEEPTSNAERAPSPRATPPPSRRESEILDVQPAEPPRQRTRGSSVKSARRKRSQAREPVEAKAPLPALEEAISRVVTPIPPPPRAVIDPNSPMAQMMDMLRSPRSIAAAMLLREVLDPPLCKRQPGFRAPGLSGRPKEQ